MAPRLAKIAALFFIFITVIGVSAYLTLTFIIKSEDTVVVPLLIGKEAVDALARLSDLGLNTKIHTTQYSLDIPKDRIISQEPQAGAEIKKGRNVRIVLSKGSQSIMSPNLRELTLQQALIILEKNDLCRGTISNAFSRLVKKGQVMAQTPAPGIGLIPGSCVDLLISLGSRPPAYKMPDLVGKSWSEAMLILEENHLLADEISFLAYEGKPKNVIVRQKPAAGQRVFENTPVKVVVNRSVEASVDDTQAHAGGVGLFQYRLQSGFLKRRIQIQLDAFGMSNTIIDDYIKPGEEIWVLVPHDHKAMVALYEDGKLVEIRVYD